MGSRFVDWSFCAHYSSSLVLLFLLLFCFVFSRKLLSYLARHTFHLRNGVRHKLLLRKDEWKIWIGYTPYRTKVVGEWKSQKKGRKPNRNLLAWKNHPLVKCSEAERFSQNFHWKILSKLSRVSDIVWRFKRLQELNKKIYMLMSLTLYCNQIK